MLCLCLSLLLQPFSMNAQICGTISNEPAERLFEMPTKLGAQFRNKQKLQIPLNFYLVSPENTHQVIDIERYIIEELNEVFQAANMKFYLCRLPTPILGKKTHNYLSARELFIKIHQPKTVNIYVVNELIVTPSETAPNGKILGFASLPTRFNEN